MSKPDAINFFWKGLDILSGESKLINSFNDFSEMPSLKTLSLFYEEIQHQIRKDPDSSDILLQVIEGYQYGAQKHGESDYLNAPIENIINAIGRHLIQLLLGIKVDQESDLHHLSLIMCNILMIAELL